LSVEKKKITLSSNTKHKTPIPKIPTTKNTPPKNSAFQTEVPVVSLILLETLSKQKQQCTHPDASMARTKRFFCHFFKIKK